MHWKFLPLPMGRWCSKNIPRWWSHELGGCGAEVLAKNLGRPVLMCDRESIVAATGTGKGHLLGRQISDAAARLLAMRGPYTAPKPLPAALRPLTKGKRCCCASAPLWCRGMWKAVCC